MAHSADEPVIALDGDTAGLRAAMRLVDLALPIARGGQDAASSASCPKDQDPDDLLKAKGPEAMRALLCGRRAAGADAFGGARPRAVSFDTPRAARRAGPQPAAGNPAHSRQRPPCAIRRGAGRSCAARLFRPPIHSGPVKGLVARTRSRPFAEVQAPLPPKHASSALGAGTLSGAMICGSR